MGSSSWRHSRAGKQNYNSHPSLRSWVRKMVARKKKARAGSHEGSIPGPPGYSGEQLRGRRLTSSQGGGLRVAEATAARQLSGRRSPPRRLWPLTPRVLLREASSRSRPAPSFSHWTLSSLTCWCLLLQQALPKCDGRCCLPDLKENIVPGSRGWDGRKGGPVELERGDTVKGTCVTRALTSTQGTPNSLLHS